MPVPSMRGLKSWRLEPGRLSLKPFAASLHQRVTPTTPLRLMSGWDCSRTAARISRAFPAEATAERLEWHLADVALEEHCFVVLSRLVNSLESASGDIHWQGVPRLAQAGSGEPSAQRRRRGECSAIESELGDPGPKTSVLSATRTP